jgi:hypothetical protein
MAVAVEEYDDFEKEVLVSDVRSDRKQSANVQQRYGR